VNISPYDEDEETLLPKPGGTALVDDVGFAEESIKSCSFSRSSLVAFVAEKSTCSSSLVKCVPGKNKTASLNVAKPKDCQGMPPLSLFFKVITEGMDSPA
jgi:hypothetical protein